MTDRPVPQPGILKIAPYVPGKSQAAPGVKAIKLSANESPLGASPAALAALAEAAKTPDIYPEGTSKILREALGEVHGLDPERIVCGNGSDDLLHLLGQCYLGVGDEAVMSRHGFNVYPIITMGASAEIVMVPERDYRADVDAMLAAVTPRTKVVWLANPNNPTGTYLPASEVERLHAGLRPDILFVLDGAYAEYVTADDYDVGIELVDSAENVVMVRTFSKMGLADARIGWMYAPRAHRRCGQPHPRSVQRQPRGAARGRRRGARHRVHRKAARLQCADARLADARRSTATPSASSRARAISSSRCLRTRRPAAAAFQALFDEGLIVREIGVYGIENGLRISIGPEDAMRRLVEVLKDFGAPGAQT